MVLALSRMRVWMVVVGLMVAVIVTGVGFNDHVRAQDDEITRALSNAVSWLRLELNKPSLILVEYTFSGTSWENSAMGCPIPGQVYQPGTVHGYSWTFLFDNLVRYEVHSNLDGTQAVLCSSANTSPDVKLNLYNTTTFSILVPEAWIVYPNDDRTEALFAPEQGAPCNEPGMRVSVQGRVASGVTPDQLLDDYLAEVKQTDSASERITVGTFGRSTTLQSACSASLLRQWRVTAFVQYGSAYLVEQWSPVDDYDQWQQLFLDMLSGFAPPDAVLGVPEMGADATDSAADTGDENDEPDSAEATTTGPLSLAPLPMAHIFVGDVFLGALNDIPGRSITIAPTWERRHLAFSPDGLFLSFVDVTNGELRVLDVVNGRSPRRVAEQVNELFPPAWRDDSSALAYVTEKSGEGGESPNAATSQMVLMSVSAAGGEPERVGTFAFETNCPLTVDDPADQRYVIEAGPGGDNPVLVWLADNRFVISTRCEGGLAIYDPASDSLESLGDALRGGSLSPQGTWFVTTKDTGLAVIDMASGFQASFSVGENAHQLTWGADGETVYFARETLADTITLDDPEDEERGRDVFGAWPVEIEFYDLALIAANVNTLEEEVLWRGQGRGIGQIAPAPDGSGVVFSVVTSAQLIAEIFQAGADPLAVRESMPESALYWLPEGGDAAYLLAYAGQPVFAPVTIGVE